MIIQEAHPLRQTWSGKKVTNGCINGINATPQPVAPILVLIFNTIIFISILICVKFVRKKLLLKVANTEKKRS